jgi:SAM-dependent methyltransferase
MTQDEVAEILKRYERRQPGDLYHPLRADVYLPRQERERALLRWLRAAKLPPLAALRVLDVGCGRGADLLWLISIGLKPGNIVGNDLRPDAVATARQRLPSATLIHVGNAAEIALPDSSFDVVLQSTVFSSILDDALQRAVAKRMWDLVKPGGGVLWYDFIYNNPWNPDVRGVPIRRVRQLFPSARLESARRLALAPPISRAVTVVHPVLYNVLNTIPWLRSHFLCWLVKPLDAGGSARGRAAAAWLLSVPRILGL